RTFVLDAIISVEGYKQLVGANGTHCVRWYGPTVGTGDGPVLLREKAKRGLRRRNERPRCCLRRRCGRWLHDCKTVLSSYCLRRRRRKLGRRKLYKDRWFVWRPRPCCFLIGLSQLLEVDH